MGSRALAGRHRRRAAWGWRDVACRLAIVIALLVGHLAHHAGAARAAGWSTPVRISGETIAPWFPDVAADDSDRVHVVWNGDFGGTARHEVGALYYTRGDQGAWSRPNDIALIWRGHALRSSLATDAAGGVHLIYKGLGTLQPDSLVRRDSLGQEDLWHMTAAGAASTAIGAWSVPTKISGGTHGYFSDIAVDSRGVIHAIMTEPESGQWGIFYRRSADGGATWSRRVALDGTYFVWWYRAHLKIDAFDRLHVVWEMTDLEHLGVTLGATHAFSADGGMTWTLTRFERDTQDLPLAGAPATPLPGPQQPSVGVDGWGRVILVYRDPANRRIFYRLTHDGREWSAPSPLPGVSAGVTRPYDLYEMATDSAGHIHLVVVGYPTGSDWMSLLHSVWDGRGWGAPAVITAAPPTPEYAARSITRSPEAPPTRSLLSPPYPEYPRLVISRGNRLHLVWFGGDRPSVDREPVGVWYSTSLADAAAVAPRAAAVAPAPSPRRPTEVTARPMASATVPVLPPRGHLEAADEAMAPVTHHQWQEYPILIAAVAVMPVLIIMLLVRCLPFDRRGRWTDG